MNSRRHVCACMHTNMGGRKVYLDQVFNEIIESVACDISRDLLLALLSLKLLLIADYVQITK